MPDLISKDKKSPIFRREALDYAIARSYGTILIAHQPFQSAMGFFGVLVAIGIMCFIYLGAYTQKAEISGYLRPTLGIIEISSKKNGIVTQKFIKENQFVTKGTPLFLIDNDQSTTLHKSTAGILNNLLQSQKLSLIVEEVDEENKSREKKILLARVIDELKFQINKIKEQVTLQTQRVKIADDNLRRYQALYAAHTVSLAVEEDQKSDLLIQKQTQLDLEKALSQRRAEEFSAEYVFQTQNIEMREQSQPLKRQIASIDAQLISTEIDSQNLVRAPCDGVVTAVNVDVGQTWQANKVMAMMVPKGALLEGEAFVPSNSVRFIHKGSDVNLRYAEFPFQTYGQFHGVVEDITEATVAVGEKTGSESQMYRIRIALDKQQFRTGEVIARLRSGMIFDASIMLERRRLYQWIFEPFHSVVDHI
jgi:membrane fusion protein